MDKFKTATGIKRSDWFGKYWAKWGDALTAAGFPPNEFGSPAYDEEQLLEQLVELDKKDIYAFKRNKTM